MVAPGVRRTACDGNPSHPMAMTRVTLLLWFASLSALHEVLFIFEERLAAPLRQPLLSRKVMTSKVPQQFAIGAFIVRFKASHSQEAEAGRSLRRPVLWALTTLHDFEASKSSVAFDIQYPTRPIGWSRSSSFGTQEPAVVRGVCQTDDRARFVSDPKEACSSSGERSRNRVSE
jgi:hypothetical protein